MPQDPTPTDKNKNKDKDKDKNSSSPLSFLASPTSITGYFIIIIFLSIYGLFSLFPTYDLIYPPGKIVITDLITKDTIVKIKGNLEPLSVENQLTDSLTLRLDIARRVIKDTVAKDTIIESEHSISFPGGTFPNHDILWLIIIVGILGASIHALTSLSEYVGNNTFDTHWSLWYYLRPFVGALLALLSYWFLRAGLFTIESTKDLYGILAVAGLIGIFSKQALYKISDIANAIFTSNHEKYLKGKLSENPVPKVNSAEQSITIGDIKPTITLTGENFVDTTKVFYNKEELPTVIKSPTEIEVSFREESIPTDAGDMVLKIVNPPPGGGDVKKTILVLAPEREGAEDQVTGIPAIPPNDDTENTDEATPPVNP